jgi:hypothetical protein
VAEDRLHEVSSLEAALMGRAYMELREELDPSPLEEAFVETYSKAVAVWRATTAPSIEHRHAQES